MADISKIQLPNGTSYDLKDIKAHFYGTCSTASNTANKTVDIPNFTSADLVEGTIVAVHFTNQNNANSPTLNVSSTGAVYMYGGIYFKSSHVDWAPQQVVLFMYKVITTPYWVAITGWPFVNAVDFSSETNNTYRLKYYTAPTSSTIIEIPKSSYTDTKITNPSTKSTGQFLQYDGTSWVAASLPIYNGSVRTVT